MVKGRQIKTAEHVISVNRVGKKHKWVQIQCVCVTEREFLSAVHKSLGDQTWSHFSNTHPLGSSYTQVVIFRYVSSGIKH